MSVQYNKFYNSIIYLIHTESLIALKAACSAAECCSTSLGCSVNFTAVGAGVGGSGCKTLLYELVYTSHDLQNI